MRKIKNVLCTLGILWCAFSFAENKETSCQQLHADLGRVRVVDVRTPEEFSGSEGHIPGAQLVTLGPELTRFLKEGNLEERIVFVCRSGRRSLQAVQESMALGYQNTQSLKGGMLEWKAKGFPTDTP